MQQRIARIDIDAIQRMIAKVRFGCDRNRPRVAHQVIANLRFSMILLAFFGLAIMLNSNSGHKASPCQFSTK
jgi:hypothetical protein